MTTQTLKPQTPSKTTNIRIRLSDSEIDDLETVRQFLGLPSVSATAARLALWNAKTIATSLRTDCKESAMADSISDMTADAVRLTMRRYLLEH